MFYLTECNLLIKTNYFFLTYIYSLQVVMVNYVNFRFTGMKHYLYPWNDAILN